MGVQEGTVALRWGPGPAGLGVGAGISGEEFGRRLRELMDTIQSLEKGPLVAGVLGAMNNGQMEELFMTSAGLRTLHKMVRAG